MEMVEIQESETKPKHVCGRRKSDSLKEDPFDGKTLLPCFVDDVTWE